ncbi:hypothetical protein HGRIS_008310 [Hohenbuehelia grisea]|uniref:SnoaL-like domain-containing protein n=1 Tax=Hohenbuehelia grisea TaxID=104357 RepID=A0ABR3J7K5_9AGAR
MLALRPRTFVSLANAAGLKPFETKALKERAPKDHESKIIQSLKEMYSCQPTENTFDIYARDAVFHDPIGIAEGLDSVRAQFIGLKKIFPRADIPKFRVLEAPASVPTNVILIDQDVAYYRDPQKSPTKTVNSLLTLETNDAHQVTRHTEEWDHSKTTSADDGFLGMLNEQRKKLTASLTNMVVGKDAKE